MIAKGNAIKYLRHRQHKNQRVLAAEVGVSQNTVCVWERGHNISRENAVMLANSLGCGVYDIAEELPSGARISNTNVKSDNLRRLRKAQGMTQTVLAELTGTVQAEVSFWENGVHSISMQYAQKVSEALGCKMTDIIKLKGDLI